MIATQVSSPIRSASAQRTHWVRKPELGDRVERIGLGDTVWSAQTASLMNASGSGWRRNPGKSFA